MPDTELNSDLVLQFHLMRLHPKNEQVYCYLKQIDHRFFEQNQNFLSAYGMEFTR